MPEAMLIGVIRNIIENLGSHSFQEIGSFFGVEDELHKIGNTVSRIDAVLEDAVEQQNDSHQFKVWLEKLKDVVYEVDDLLGELSAEALQRRVMAEKEEPIKKKVGLFNFFSSSNSRAFRSEMGHKIREIRKKLNAIASDENNFCLREYPLGSRNVVSRMGNETHSSYEMVIRREDGPEMVIGREVDKRAIIDLLLEPNVEQNVSVISIVGLGGLGKTTLAKYVYNDEIVRAHFELQMWVCVSDVFDIKIIVENIIMAVTSKLLQNDDMDELQDHLRKVVDQKKYFLVLDDVWNEDREKWLRLKSLLMGGAKGSMIVITTRSKLVAELTDPVSGYTLLGLSKDESWSLFKKVAFSQRQETHELETIGRQIVNKCRGSPLFIKSIGGVLRFEERVSDWLRVKNKALAALAQQESGYFPILKLSYDYLPTHLKACFAFCSLFPQDYEIDKETLIQIWIAQELIQSFNRNQSLEDVANEFYRDLLWRSFFQEEKSLGGRLSFKMHDLMHDLAQVVAGTECTIIDLGKGIIHEKIRHVSFPFYIDSSFTETLSSLAKSAKIRTVLLTFREYRSGVLDASMLNTLILSLKSLRALDLHGLKIARVPDSIDKLIHLKYLDLSYNNKLTFLPDSITRLRNLQTLKLSCCWSLEKLPKDIRELVNLEHLCDIGCEGLNQMPCGLGQITSLRTLSLFVVHKDSPSISRHIGGLDELYQLNNLRGTLEIKILGQLKDANLESKGANLKEKQHLERLSLKWNHVVNDDEKSLKGLQPHQNLKYLTVVGYAGVRFSSWLSSLTNLVDLSLERCKRCRYLPPLSLLTSLESICLWEMSGLEYISVSDISEEVPATLAASTIFLPSLKSLTIGRCVNLKGWWRRRDFVEEVNNGNDNAVATTSASMPDHHQHHLSLPLFPCLSSLYIYNSPKLTSMPLFPYLEECLSLKKVSLKPLQQTMAAASSLPSTSFSSSSPLSKLKSMTLEDIESLPDEWALNLNSLQSLKISKCPKLTSLSRDVRYLTSLKHLEIGDCEEFDLFTNKNDNGMEWQALNCLRSLTFEGVPKLEYLPADLQYVTTLQELNISKCPNLMIMPEWIGKLTSLEQLEIIGCPNLTSLPDGMRCLRSLKKLRIARCPLLQEKCHEEIGEDWLKIAHVPDISIEL